MSYHVNVLWGARVVIPKTFQGHILDELHWEHPGMCSMKGLARSYVWWAMTSTENNYAQIEKELFNIIFACKRFHQFIYWTPVKAETDHKPVVNIIKKPLNE